nr:hypothetical protein GCM10020185_27770 [Pseudomonas brassicacearum subsp. brassicacearum]
MGGLISCGNRQPLLVPHEMRMACQTIGQVLSLQISAMQALELNRQRDAKLEDLQVLATVMAESSENVFDGLSHEPQRLMDLTGASGVAIFEDNKLHRHGQCPEPEQIRELHKWILETGKPVLSHHNLSSDFAPAQAYQDVASGVLAIHLPKPVENGVLWFRPEVKQTLQWSGDPQKNPWTWKTARPACACGPGRLSRSGKSKWPASAPNGPMAICSPPTTCGARPWKTIWPDRCARSARPCRPAMNWWPWCPMTYAAR